jgi:hypothetical protein
MVASDARCDFPFSESKAQEQNFTVDRPIEVTGRPTGYLPKSG